MPPPWPLLGKLGGHSAAPVSFPGLLPLIPSYLLLTSTFRDEELSGSLTGGHAALWGFRRTAAVQGGTEGTPGFA